MEVTVEKAIEKYVFNLFYGSLTEWHQKIFVNLLKLQVTGQIFMLQFSCLNTEWCHILNGICGNSLLYFFFSSSEKQFYEKAVLWILNLLQIHLVIIQQKSLFVESRLNRCSGEQLWWSRMSTAFTYLELWIILNRYCFSCCCQWE